MNDFPITVKVKDVSKQMFLAVELASFEDEDVGTKGSIASAGDAILFLINDKQYAISITKILNTIYNHTKK